MQGNYKTFKVKFEIEVTVENKKDVLNQAVRDIRELYAQGLLEASIKKKTKL